MAVVQFNLLPDVKLEFDRQQRTKRTVYTVSILASAVALAIVVVSFVLVNILQAKVLSDAGKDIDKYSKQLKSIPDLDRVLTIQNQLNSLPALHNTKHITSRFFTYLPEITPSNIFVGQTVIDASSNAITINGTSDTLASINTFVDTLKFTRYPLTDITDQNACNTAKGDWDKDEKVCSKKAFSGVVLTSSGRSQKGATYVVNANFDPALFDASKNITLIVPQEVTTRSVTETPDINTLLFNGQTTENSKTKDGQQ